MGSGCRFPAGHEKRIGFVDDTPAAKRDHAFKTKISRYTRIVAVCKVDGAFCDA